MMDIHACPILRHPRTHCLPGLTSRKCGCSASGFGLHSWRYYYEHFSMRWWRLPSVTVAKNVTYSESALGRAVSFLFLFPSFLLLPRRLAINLATCLCRRSFPPPSLSLSLSIHTDLTMISFYRSLRSFWDVEGYQQELFTSQNQISLSLPLPSEF
ncbi:hypothetical protein BC835DRAFT_1333642 [Cytidiella melzeri]|nr:hypothetical protein BC835DRAFT_1333642 [Cytidiella melzeri]